MKKILVCFVSLIIFVIGNTVYADEVYYINNYGLHFTKFQYDAMVNVLDENSVANMTYFEYDAFMVNKINEQNYKAVTYDDAENYKDRGSTYHETSCKKLSLASVCDSVSCTVVLTTDWKCVPAVKSYDVTGIRLSSTNFYGDGELTFHTKENGTYDYDDGWLGASNGIGYAFKLPSSGNIEYAMMSASVKPKGVIFGSYQHAVESISLNTALDFTFSPVGAGGVFEWSYTNKQKFDRMGGVYLQIP